MHSQYKLGQYLYVDGGDKRPNGVLVYQPIPTKADLKVNASTNGRVVSISQTAYGVVAHLESSTKNTPKISTEIRLYDNEKKIELSFEIDKTEVHNREAAYIAFPLLH